MSEGALVTLPTCVVTLLVAGPALPCEAIAEVMDAWAAAMAARWLACCFRALGASVVSGEPCDRSHQSRAE